MLSLQSAEKRSTRPMPPAVHATLAPASPTLRVSPCHRLSDSTLAGAEVRQMAGSPALDTIGQAWLLRAACQEAAVWASRSLQPGGLHVTVGLARHSMRGGTLLAQVAAALHGSGLPGPGLRLSIAESELADARPDLLLLVSALRDFGAGVAMDSAACLDKAEHVLRRLPLNALRLHPALVRGAERDPEARAGLARIIRFAHMMDCRVTALGVGTALQRDILADLHCDGAQGRLFGQDLPGSAFRAGLS